MTMRRVPWCINSRKTSISSFPGFMMCATMQGSFISEKYLNECVKEILGRNAKSLIDEQLIMRARHELKFTDKSIKEVGFELGFNTPDYFTYFVKKHTGLSPSQLRKD